ncbi:hypothetical protein U1Q18_043734, partial [Sarracenia purpurea var. burkii]
VRVLDSVEGDIFIWCWHRVLVRSHLMGLVCELVAMGIVTIRAVVRVEFLESHLWDRCFGKDA